MTTNVSRVFALWNLKDEVYDVVLVVIFHSTFAKSKTFVLSSMIPNHVVINLGLDYHSVFWFLLLGRIQRSDYFTNHYYWIYLIVLSVLSDPNFMFMCAFVVLYYFYVIYLHMLAIEINPHT